MARLLLPIGLAIIVAAFAIAVALGDAPPPPGGFHNVSTDPNWTPNHPDYDVGCAPANPSSFCPENLTTCQVTHPKSEWPTACKP